MMRITNQWAWVLTILFTMIVTMPRAAEDSADPFGGMLGGGQIILESDSNQTDVNMDTGNMVTTLMGNVILNSEKINLLCEVLVFSQTTQELWAKGTEKALVKVDMQQGDDSVRASCENMTLKMSDESEGTTIVLTGNPIIQRDGFSQEGDRITIIQDDGDPDIENDGKTTICVVMLTNRRGVLKTGASVSTTNTTSTTDATTTAAAGSSMGFGGGMMDKMTCTFTGKQEIVFYDPPEGPDAEGEMDLKITGDVILRSEKFNLDCDVLTYSSKTGKMLALGTGSKRAYAKIPMAQNEYVEAWCQQMEVITNPDNSEETKIILTGKPEIKRGGLKQSGGRIVIEQKDGKTTLTNELTKGQRARMEIGGGVSATIPESNLPGAKESTPKPKKVTTKPVVKKTPKPTPKKPPII